jgi:hypothetical protein
MLAFDHRGLLPARDYPLTFRELRTSVLVVGPPGNEDWDCAWRATLVDNLEVLVKQLWTIGIADIYINGSFVEMKTHPNDIDGYFVTDLKRFATGDLERELNSLEPDKIWTWRPASRRPCIGFTKLQLPMWHKYRVELYPHFNQSSGIVDKYGNEMQFPAAFRVERYTYEQKGIVKILEK